MDCRQRLRTHLINTRGGVWEANEQSESGKDVGELNPEQPIFGPATLLFLGHRAPRLCSLVTPRGRPKSLVAPSASIYEMGSRLFLKAITGLFIVVTIA